MRSLCASSVFFFSVSFSLLNAYLSSLSPFSLGRMCTKKWSACCPATPPFAMKTFAPVVSIAFLSALTSEGSVPKRWLNVSGGTYGRIG